MPSGGPGQRSMRLGGDRRRSYARRVLREYLEANGLSLDGPFLAEEDVKKLIGLDAEAVNRLRQLSLRPERNALASIRALELRLAFTLARPAEQLEVSGAGPVSINIDLGAPEKKAIDVTPKPPLLRKGGSKEEKAPVTGSTLGERVDAYAVRERSHRSADVEVVVQKDMRSWRRTVKEGAMERAKEIFPAVARNEALGAPTPGTGENPPADPSEPARAGPSEVTEPGTTEVTNGGE